MDSKWRAAIVLAEVASIPQALIEPCRWFCFFLQTESPLSDNRGLEDFCSGAGTEARCAFSGPMPESPARLVSRRRHLPSGCPSCNASRRAQSRAGRLVQAHHVLQGSGEFPQQAAQEDVPLERNIRLSDFGHRGLASGLTSPAPELGRGTKPPPATMTPTAPLRNAKVAPRWGVPPTRSGSATRRCRSASGRGCPGGYPRHCFRSGGFHRPCGA